MYIVVQGLEKSRWHELVFRHRLHMSHLIHRQKNFYESKFLWIFSVFFFMFMAQQWKQSPRMEEIICSTFSDENIKFLRNMI